MQEKISRNTKGPLVFVGFILAAVLFGPVAASAKFSSTLEGQSNGSTNWIGNNLQGWHDWDYIPMRVSVSGGPATSQAIEVFFEHYRGTNPGVEDLSGFTTSANVTITAGPTLNAPANSGTWSYTFTVNLNDKFPGYVQFRGRLAAGAHLNPGSSLHLGGTPTLSTLQIAKTAEAAGSPDLAIFKRGPAQANPGSIITYTVIYTNKATSASDATLAQVSDVLPAAVTYVANSASGNVTLVGSSLYWDIGAVPRGASGSVTYQARVKAATSNGQTFANYAQIFSGEDDANYADNLSQVTTTVVVTHAPVANDDAYTMNEDGVLNVPAPGVLSNDADADGSDLTVMLVGIPAHGSLSFSTNGGFVYTPAPNFNGNDSFTYRAIDDAVQSGLATVTITVRPVADPPLAIDDAYNLNEDATLAIAVPGVLANDSDVDGDTLTALLVTNPAHGNLTLSSAGGFVYTPNPNFNGLDSFTYKAHGATLDSAAATVRLTVNAVNDPPSFTKGPDQLVDEDAPTQTLTNWATNISAGSPDETSQTLTFIVSNDTNALFSVQPAITPAGTLTYTPAPHAYGVAHVSVVLNDNGGTANGGVDSSAPQTFTITVNAPPMVSIFQPTNNTVFIAPADITVIADAHDVDGTISQVRIYQGTNLLLETNSGPYFTIWANVPAGNYQVSAQATDNFGAKGTSSPVNIAVLSGPPLLVITPPHFNPQTGLFEEMVRILNPSPASLRGARVSITNLAAGVKVFNATGTTNGMAYVQTLLSIAAGGSSDLTIEFYVPNFQTPNPALSADIVAAAAQTGPPLGQAGTPTVTPVPITRQMVMPNREVLLEFNSTANRTYFVEYSSDMKTWKVAWPSIGGTGNRIQWIDNGAPRTESMPTTQMCRFYRVIMAP